MIINLLRKTIRSRYKPMDVEYAQRWKKRLSIIYMVIAWHLGTFTVYLLVKDKYPKSTDPEKYKKLSEINGVKENTVLMKYDGITKVEEINVENNANKF